MSPDPKKHVLLREKAYTDQELIELYIHQSYGVSQIDHDPELLKKLRRKLGLLAPLAEMLDTERRLRVNLEDRFKSLSHEWTTLKDFLRPRDPK